MQANFFEYLQDSNIAQLVLCEDDKESFLLSQVALFKDLKTFVLPDFRAEFGDDLRAFSKELFELCKVLNAYHKEKDTKILISPLSTILKKLPGQKHLKNYKLSKKNVFNLSEFKNELNKLGYEFVDMVQDKGEVSIRGEIIDIFCINEELPTRVLLFGDELESIRKFDPMNQKSFPKEYEELEICPFLTYFSEENYENFKDKLENFNSDVLINDINSLGFWCIDDFCDYLELDFISIKKFNQEEWDKDLSKINAKIIPQASVYKDLKSSYNKDFFSLQQNKKITILAKNEALFKALELENTQNISFQKSDLILNLISNQELIISLNHKEKQKYKRKANLIIDELKIGDFIVHEDYGVGKFLGLEMISISGAKKEFVAIEYQNSDKLLLPVENLYTIDKYLGASGGIPLLDRLGKMTFIRLKERLKTKLLAIASEIVIMAAKRALIKPKEIKIDYADQAYFVSKAGFSYTQDQNKACEEILNDFENGKVMDRLLSGDVGFGKTEVAMNAIYPVVKSGFCAFFFAPTTLLSHQHYKSLKKRFEPFGIEVFKLDRFTSTKEKKTLMLNLEQNKACVVIGAHALLNVECENLALVIIDEEHKFGVKQKEKLKELTQNSHLLSMSATPIPRSLNQALSSIKSYSVLQTPPEDRLDVRTFVKENDDALLKEAITRELRRGGQIFYIHNHIASIEQCKKHLLDLFKNLRILILHSKIDAKIQEEEMLKFENKEYDLLLSTSIVESGIDLPNANTMIVERSDRFGMADLHQLRGRVGRSDRQGYCYFLVENKEELTQDALKRLVSLESNSYLGAGSVLAYHDLEIRGGGNLLGIDQSGHIEQIGLSLYLKMLEDELNALTKKESFEGKKIDLKLTINAFLNSELINEDRLRLELYRRLSKCKNIDEVYEIEGEIEDRFGKLDLYTKQFLTLIIIKILALGKFKTISNFEQNIQFVKINDEKEFIKARSKDDDDIIEAVLTHLRKDK
ncbi:transcription-repair coupling factor [Campylobacter coli]|uniref:DEAD/DEAH box helicase n=1 Tax=Campylobacter coli TaxID=195 RepID=UPI00087549C8|nr:DEAD/DEAH box helicase [Campylobacter coli]OEW84279.1 transcription-repair coupling factor [Campylobacter coli]OEX19091.1 transcription-repair coupling factor [Campylobacter coli]OEX23396.1 transcription-repair coupling factor [Campylobacter coli]OEX40206.1 transcription-repair coupling factor [Campylobacter coli]OEX80814.1 transcription-repair coupling factor [Campylobacter coli]